MGLLSRRASCTLASGLKEMIRFVLCALAALVSGAASAEESCPYSRVTYVHRESGTRFRVERAEVRHWARIDWIVLVGTTNGTRVVVIFPPGGSGWASAYSDVEDHREMRLVRNISRSPAPAVFGIGMNMQGVVLPHNEYTRHCRPVPSRR